MVAFASLALHGLTFIVSVCNMAFLFIWMGWKMMNVFYEIMRDWLFDRQEKEQEMERLYNRLRPTKDEFDCLKQMEGSSHKEFKAERATMLAFFNALALEPQTVIARVCTTIGWQCVSVRNGDACVEIFKRDSVVIVSFCSPYSITTNVIKSWLTGEFSRNHEIAESRVGVRTFYTRPLTNAFKSELMAHLDSMEPNAALYFTGHGIAAGYMMACVAQLLLQSDKKFKHTEALSVYSFGQPRVLTKSAVNDHLLGGGVPIFRCTTFCDPLPRGFDLLPARVLNLLAEYVVHRSSRDMGHIGKEIRIIPFANSAQEFNADGNFVKELPYKMQYKYPFLVWIMRRDVMFDAVTYFRQFARLIRH